MSCIDELDYEILLPSSSIKECADYIKKNFKEIYYVRQGYMIFNTSCTDIILMNQNFYNIM